MEQRSRKRVYSDVGKDDTARRQQKKKIDLHSDWKKIASMIRDREKRSENRGKAFRGRKRGRAFDLPRRIFLYRHIISARHRGSEKKRGKKRNG